MFALVFLVFAKAKKQHFTALSNAVPLFIGCIKN